MKLKFKTACLVLLVFIGCNQQERNSNKNSETLTLTTQDSVKLKSYLSKAFQQSLFSQERQQYLDSALLDISL